MTLDQSSNQSIIEGFEIKIVLNNGDITKADGIFNYMNALEMSTTYYELGLANQVIIYNTTTETYTLFNTLEEINDEIKKLQKLSETTIDWMRPR